MSEQGWRDFLTAQGLEDWVVLHGGPTGLGPRTVLTLSSDRLTVRLTREMWGVEPGHIEVAAAISRVARERGATADRRGTQEVQLAIAARSDEIDLPFWRAVLGYAPLHEDNALDPLGHGSTVWMQELDPGKPLRHAMHLDVSVAREVAEERLAAAVAAGGRIVEQSEAPAAWILADRAGNKVCIAAWPDGAVAASDNQTPSDDPGASRDQ